MEDEEHLKYLENREKDYLESRILDICALVIVAILYAIAHAR